MGGDTRDSDTLKLSVVLMKTITSRLVIRDKQNANVEKKPWIRSSEFSAFCYGDRMREGLVNIGGAEDLQIYLGYPDRPCNSGRPYAESISSSKRRRSLLWCHHADRLGMGVARTTSVL